VCKDGSTYDGEWFGDLFDGTGILKHHNGSIYEGEYKLGKKTGKGKLILVNRD
jgi:hypothetical protein